MTPVIFSTIHWAAVKVGLSMEVVVAPVVAETRSLLRMVVPTVWGVAEARTPTLTAQLVPPTLTTESFVQVELTGTLIGVMVPTDG